MPYPANITLEPCHEYSPPQGPGRAGPGKGLAGGSGGSRELKPEPTSANSAEPGPGLLLKDEQAGRAIATERGLDVAGTAALIGMA